MASRPPIQGACYDIGSPRRTALRWKWDDGGMVAPDAPDALGRMFFLINQQKERMHKI